MNDLSIRCFFSVARTGSFTSAAKEQAISQQAVSQNIQRLEEELNVKLLNRNGKREYLTEAGAAFLEWAQELDQSLASASTCYAQHNGQIIISVGITDYVQLPEKLAKLIQKYLDVHPQVNLHFQSDSVKSLISKMQNQIIDFCIMPGNCEQYLQGITSMPLLYSVPMYLIVNGKLYDRYGKNDLPIFPHLELLTVNMGETNEAQTIARAQAFCVRLGIPISNVRVLPNVETLYLELYNGNGYAILPETPVLSQWHDELRLLETNMALPLIVTCLMSNEKKDVIGLIEHLKGEITREGGHELHDKYRSIVFP